MWSTTQGNSQRNGQSGAPGMLVLKTDTDFGSSTMDDIAQAPVFGANDTLYFVSVGGCVQCRAVSTPDKIWQYQGPSSPTSLTIGVDGTLYYGHSQGLSALSSSGALLWTFNTYGACLSAPALGSDGTIYGCFARPPANYAVALVGVSPSGQATQFAIWSSALPNGSPMSIATVNGVESVLYPSNTSQIMPYATANGAPTLTGIYGSVGGWVQGSIVAANGVLYVATLVAGLGQLSACNGAGAILWTYNLNQPMGVASTPALGLDGNTIYIIGADLHAVNIANGLLVWQTSGMTFLGSPVVSSDGYVGAINVTTRGLEFRDMQGTVTGTPYYAMGMATGPMSVSSDGSVFIAQTNGRVRIARNSPAGTPVPPPAQAPAPVPPPAPAPSAPAPAPAPAPPSVLTTSALCYGQTYPASVQFATQGQLRELAPCTFSPAGLAVDSSAQIAYWADGPAIYKCAVAGGPVQMVVNGLDFNPTSLALDLANMRIFCCDAGGGAVCCINLASAKTVRLVTGLALPVAVAVDVSANQLFWVEYNSGCLQKSDLAGQSVTRLLSDLTLPQSVAIDLVHQQLYWAAKTEIASCDYGGLGSVTAITLTPAQPNSNSRKLALDSEAQKLYWSDQASQTIQCLDLVDGILITVMSKALTSAFANPSGIALVQTLAG